MRPITRTTICAIIAAAMAAPAYAATDFFLKFDDIKGESVAKSAPEKKIEVESWSWGATRKARVATLKSDLSTAKVGETATASGGVQVAAGDVNADGRADTISKPLDRGSMTVQGSLPGCTVGARYGGAQFSGGAYVYTFKDIMVTSCTLDSISFDYASYRESPTRPSAR